MILAITSTRHRRCSACKRWIIEHHWSEHMRGHVIRDGRRPNVIEVTHEGWSLHVAFLRLDPMVGNYLVAEHRLWASRGPVDAVDADDTLGSVAHAG